MDELDSLLQLHKDFSQKVLGFSAGARGVISNGRVLGPLENDEEFTPDDFSLLERFSLSGHVDKIYGALTKKLDGMYY